MASKANVCLDIPVPVVGNTYIKITLRDQINLGKTILLINLPSICKRL